MTAVPRPDAFVPPAAPAAPRSGAFPFGAAAAPASDDQAAVLRGMVAPVQVGAIEHASESGAAAGAPSMPLVAVASGKGGVGKTTLSVNLCVALAQAGARPVLLDADVGLANADILCGLDPRHRLLRGPGGAAPSLADVATPAPGGFLLVPGVSAMQSPASRAADAQGPRAWEMIGALPQLSALADVAVIDTPAGIGPDVLAAVAAADVAIVVATPDPASIADAYAVLKIASALPGGPASTVLVVNRAASLEEGRRVHARLDAASRRFLGRALWLLGIVREDRWAGKAARGRTPLACLRPKADASRDIAEISEKLGRLCRTHRVVPRRFEGDLGVIGASRAAATGVTARHLGQISSPVAAQLGSRPHRYTPRGGVSTA